MDEPRGFSVPVEGTIEISSDFVRCAIPVPDAVFRQPAGGAFGRRSPADSAMLEFLRRGFGLVCIELAIDVEAEFPFCIACDRHMGPAIGRHAFPGDDGVVHSATHPNAKLRVEEIHV